MDETRTLNEPEEDSALTEELTIEQRDEAPERLSLTCVDRLIRRGTKSLRRMSTANLDVPVAAEQTSFGTSRYKKKSREVEKDGVVFWGF